MEQTYPRCLFCGHDNQRGVGGAGPPIYVCFDCIDLAAEIKAETLADPPPAE